MAVTSLWHVKGSIKDVIDYTYELKVLNKKNNPFVWIYGIFKLQHLRKI